MSGFQGVVDDARFGMNAPPNASDKIFDSSAGNFSKNFQVLVQRISRGGEWSSDNGIGTTALKTSQIRF